MKYLSSRQMSEVTGVSLETLKKQRFRNNSPYKFIKEGRRVLYLAPEPRVSMDNEHESPPMSTTKKSQSRVPSLKKRSGRGFHSGSRYWAYGSQLRLINEKRKKQKLERMAKQNAKEVFEEERVRSTKVLNDDRPRRKFQGYGYSEPPTIEVTPAPMNQEPRFKNKIEEYIHIAKQSKL